MKNIHFFTICSVNYASQAAVLKKSLDRTHPNIPFTVFLCDEIGEHPPETLSGITHIPVSATGMPLYENMCQRYSILELNTAVKPYCFIYLFEKHGADFAFYLDPDLLAVSPMVECLDLAEQGANVILTPHTTEPIEDELHPNDHDMARAGIYNLGFCGVARSEEGRRFVGWWARKLAKDCRVDLANGVFVDQKWCDAVPALYEGVAVLRHQGYNVGYWNLMHRPLHRNAEGTLMTGRDEARLLHFSGIEITDALSVSKHQNRLTLRNVNAETRDAFLAYKFELFAERFFENSAEQPVLPVAHLFRKPHVNNNYVRMLTTCLEAVGARERPASELDLVRFDIASASMPQAQLPLPDYFFPPHRIRPDLAKAFPDLEKLADAERYLAWWRTSGVGEWEMTEPGDTLRAAALQSLQMITDKAIVGTAAHASPRLQKAFIGLADTDPKSVYLAMMSLTGHFELGLPDDAGPFAIPLFLQLLRRTRHDLTTLFDVRTEKGREEFLQWAVHNFTQEYGRTDRIDELMDTIRRDARSWSDKFLRTDGSAHRTRPSGEIDRRSWFAAIEYGLKRPENYAIFLERESANAPLRADDPSKLLVTEPLRDVITLVGYSRAEMGMGEHVRNTAAALASGTLPFEMFDFNVRLNCSTGNREYANRLVRRPSGRINVFHINADQTMLADAIFGDALFGNRYNIGYWAWELEHFPSEWTKAIDLVDEIWAPSEFIRSALRKATGKPVIHMPLRVEPGAASAFDLAARGIDGGAFKFLFFFDFASFHSRKNPWATIEAFSTAFPTTSNANVQLILKSIGANRHTEAAAGLERTIAGDPRIVHIAESLPGDRMNALIAASDCFVSLHRSEGFGRGMAEAMYHGRPTIATAYGGNMDFMNEENSLLVDYRLIPVGKSEYVHAEGCRWADPDTEHAAACMRRVVADRALAARLGEAARRTIERDYSSKAVEARLTGRLEEIRRRIRL